MGIGTQTIKVLDEVETEEQEAAYAAWMRAMVKEADEDPRPSIPHDVVMAKALALIAAMKKRHQQKASAA